MLDEWPGDLRGLRRSTARSYALSAAVFCRYLTDPAYGWAEEPGFDTLPVQVAHKRNVAAHMQDNEGDLTNRAFDVDELQYRNLRIHETVALTAIVRNRVIRRSASER